jgi:hypothetical protein
MTSRSDDRPAGAEGVCPVCYHADDETARLRTLLARVAESACCAYCGAGTTEREAGCEQCPPRLDEFVAPTSFTPGA